MNYSVGEWRLSALDFPLPVLAIERIDSDSKINLYMICICLNYFVDIVLFIVDIVFVHRF